MPPTLTSSAELRSALTRARSIELAAYTITPSMRRALEDASARGARVRVRVSASTAGDRGDEIAQLNQRTIADLRAHGVDAALASTPALAHAKLALLDGVLWLDDRNFPMSGPDTVIRDDRPDDVRAATSLFDGNPASVSGVAWTKRDALSEECAVLRGRGPTIDVESESFGWGPVATALEERARLGAHVRLIVAERELAESTAERGALAKLAADGVEIRVRTTAEKLAVAADSAWVGSANSTFTAGDEGEQSDWGLRLRRPDDTQDLERRFTAAWTHAKPFKLA